MGLFYPQNPPVCGSQFGGETLLVLREGCLLRWLTKD